MIYLLFMAAAMIEILGITISVIGVGQLVGMNLIIILMAVSFDIGKIATVSSLQRNWATLNPIMKIYGALAIVFTMMITSFGAASYLTTAMQSGISTVEKIDAQIIALNSEKSRLLTRKLQIDQQIADIPVDATSKVRNTILSTFQAEQERVTLRITELEAKIPELEIEKINTSGKASGIISLSKSIGVETNQLIRYLVLLIIFVFDPFAVYLIMSGNHMLIQSKNVKVLPEIEPSKPVEPVQSEEAVVLPAQKPQHIPPVVAQYGTNSPEEIIRSEHDVPLTTSVVPSILEDAEDRAGLFENDLNIASQAAPSYRPKPLTTHRGLDL